MSLKHLLHRHSSDVALLVGNGINLFDAGPDGNSWDDLLATLASSILHMPRSAVPRGISLTEFYDVLELAKPSERLQRRFCDLMAGWKPRAQHRRVARWAQAHGAPVLTTNFESTIGESIGCGLHRIGHARFTAYYPWDSYYGPAGIADPLGSFAVWHVNGMQRYRQSVRLGLTHYMGSVGRARPWLKGPQRLAAAARIDHWPGAKTWLQVFFHKPLVIFGLTLAENEVFLRWLLLERKRYFNKFPDREKKAWYVHVGPQDPGKLLFFKAVGVECVEEKDYEAIYGDATWSAPPVP